MQAVAAEVVVVGGGPAGLTAAIALAAAGVETVLIGGRRLSAAVRLGDAPAGADPNAALVAPAHERDNRTTALLAGSVTALDTLDIWRHCRERAAPLRVMRIVDDTARLIRAPEVQFAASEIGLDAFGYNIENRFLIAALAARAGALAALTTIDDDAVAVEVADNEVMVRLRDETRVRARLAVGAEGRRSLCRTAAGIAVEQQACRQTALTFNLGHSRPHDDTSTEFHTETGPFTLVPLPGSRSSLVFVVDPAEAPGLAAMSGPQMGEEIERRSHSILGRIDVEPGRGAFPLAVATARHFAARRVVLIGEAAHIIPPIGAQGLNLGLRDAATIGELVVAARRDGGDAGADALTDRYDRLRRADVRSRTVAIDLLNRSLLSDFLPLQGMRGLGLHLLKRIGPLRRAAMREGISPFASQPRLMRGESL